MAGTVKEERKTEDKERQLGPRENLPRVRTEEVGTMYSWIWLPREQ